MIHGFAGNPEEVRPLFEFLEEKGYIIECPVLAGHGQTKKELSKSDYGDWIASAEKAYLKLAGKCKRIIVIGFSMGGLLAVNLWHYGFSGLVTVNTPVYYWNPYIIIRNLLTDYRKYWRKYLQAVTDKTISSMLEFQKLLTKTKPMFGNITCRTIVIQALDDDTVYHKSADHIYKRVCANKTVYKLPHGGHMIFQSKSRDEVLRAIESFVQTC